MRRPFQILMIMFVIFSLYIIRDDIKNVYNKIFSKIENNAQSQIGNFQNIIEEVKSSDKIVKLKNITETPGPLRVPDIVIPNVNTTDLSRAGIISETNRNRNENGNLPALKENEKLDASAEAKVADMFNRQYFEHISPSGDGVDDLANQVGYEYILIGENLALGNFKDNKGLLDAWMASPGHRANILNNHYTEIGVAVGRGNFEGKQVWLAVQHFGSPRSLCPSISDVLRGTIDIEQKKINEIQKDLTDRKVLIDSGVVSEGNTTNEQITIYNQIVTNYNKLISEIKSKISEYNSQVKNYNNCVESFK